MSNKTKRSWEIEINAGIRVDVELDLEDAYAMYITQFSRPRANDDWVVQAVVYLPMEAAGELARNILSARLVAEAGAMKGGSIHREQKDTC